MQSTEFHFAIKPSAQKLSSLGQISENSLKMIMKETTENCDTEALVQVMKQLNSIYNSVRNWTHFLNISRKVLCYVMFMTKRL